MGFLKDVLSGMVENISDNKAVKEIIEMEYDDDEYNFGNNYRDVALRNTDSNYGWYTCPKCGKKFRASKMDIDHILPQSKGGDNSVYNLQMLCYHCNRSKQADTSDTMSDLSRRSAEIQRQKQSDTEYLKQLMKERRKGNK